MLLPSLREIAREHGYALAVHGSMATDLDLIAVPWVEEASDAEALMEAIREYFAGIFPEAVSTGHKIQPNPDDRPHGRRGWSMHQPHAGGPYLDISVMPRVVGEADQ